MEKKLCRKCQHMITQGESDSIAHLYIPYVGYIRKMGGLGKIDEAKASLSKLELHITNLPDGQEKRYKEEVLSEVTRQLKFDKAEELHKRGQFEPKYEKRPAGNLYSLERASYLDKDGVNKPLGELSNKRVENDFKNGS